MKARGIVPKRFRCDNAGENVVFDREQKKKGCSVTFKYTAPNTPQQNGMV
jgi:hypothetical protein